MKNIILRGFLVILVSTFVPLTLQQNSFAADSADSSFTDADLVAIAIGAATAAGIVIHEANQHGSHHHQAPGPGPTPPPAIPGNPMVLSGNMPQTQTKSHEAMGFTNYNLNSTITNPTATGQILVLNASKHTQQFTLTPVSGSNKKLLAASKIRVEPTSTCLQDVAGGTTCAFDLSFTPGQKNRTNVDTASVLYQIQGSVTSGSDYITINYINTPANASFNPAVSGTNAHSIHGAKIFSLLHVTRNNLGVLYAGTSEDFATPGYGIFMSTDGGESWIPMNNGLANLNIHALASDGTNLYAATFNHNAPEVYMSTTNGASWNNITGDLPANFRVATIAWDGKNLYAGGGISSAATSKKSSQNNGRVYVKNSNDNSWNLSLDGSTPIYTLFFDGSNLYAGAIMGSGKSKNQFDGGIYKKEHFGDSWRYNLDGNNVMSITKAGDYLYAITENYEHIGTFTIRRSYQGNSWDDEPIATIPSAYTIYNYQNNLYVGTWTGHIFRIGLNSKNTTPEDISDGLIPVFYILALTADENNLYAASFGGGAYRATVNNSNFHWNSFTNGLADIGINAIVKQSINEKNSEKLYVATSGMGIFTSADSGANWVADNDDFDPNYPFSVWSLYIFNNGTDNKIYTGMPFRAYSKSLNGSSSWTPINDLSRSWVSAFYGMNLERNQTNSLFAGTWHDNAIIYRSDDGGSWYPNGQGLPAGTDIYAFASNPLFLFAGTRQHGVYRYENERNQGLWVDDGFPGSGSNIYALGTFLSDLYAGCDDGVYLRLNPNRSKNMMSWDSINNGALSSPIPIRAIYGEAYDGYLYAGGSRRSNQYTIFRKLPDSMWEGIGIPDVNKLDVTSLITSSQGTNNITSLFVGTSDAGINQILLQNPYRKK